MGCPGARGRREEDVKIYEYKLGIRELDTALGEQLDNISNKLTHHCLLYGDEIFELLRDGYHRRNKSDCDDYDKYTWDSEICGTSIISPDDLDDYIKNYANLKYNAITNNCQDFVMFLLKKVDPGKINKYTKNKMCSGSVKKYKQYFYD